MTTTTVLNAQSFGTGANKGNGLFGASPTTFQATTTAFLVCAEVTAGAGPTYSGAKQDVRVYYTSSCRSLTAAQALARLGQTVRYVDLRVPDTGGVVQIKDSTLEPVTGQYFYFWVDAPSLLTAATLSVFLVELP